MNKISLEKLKELLKYDPETGLFTRLSYSKYTNKTNVRFGKVVGRLTYDGYIEICLSKIYYRAHRLAWFYMTGNWPNHEIDHIDGIKINNKWVNLRKATRSQNMENQKKPMGHNKSGFLGVICESNGTFSSQIQVKKVRHYLGVFKTPELAHEAYLKAKRQLHEFNTL